MEDGPIWYIGTHDNTFHTDDVLAVAILKRIFDNAKVLRSRDPDIWEMCDFLIDVGGIYDHSLRRYDHHMRNFPVADDGHPLSSAGLVWYHYSHVYFRKIGIPRTYEIDGVTVDVWNRVNQVIRNRWIIPIDLRDNGIGTASAPLLEMVTALSPTKSEKSREAYDQGFHTAVKIASFMFERACQHAADYVRTKAEFMGSKKTYLENGRILVSDVEAIDFSVFVNSSVCFVVYPVHSVSDTSPHYLVRPIFDRYSQDYKIPIPTRLLGARDEELSELGLPGIEFIHHSGFMIRAADRQSAIDFCKRLIREFETKDHKDFHRQGHLS